MEPKNTQKLAYNFKELCHSNPDLKPYVFVNKHQNETIDFSNPKAVKALNKAILFTDFGIKYWDFPDENLCPPIPGRAAYINQLSNLLKSFPKDKTTHILDIGTGATCIYPLIGNALFEWTFTGTDVDENSLKHAQKIIDKNNLNSKITLKFQSSSYNIFKNIIGANDQFMATICNPPFYESQEAADKEHRRKLKGLGLENDNSERNFSGKSNELWVQGGELSFIKKYINESFLFKNQCLWFTILVSKKENIRKAKVALKKLNATEVRAMPLEQGHKISRIIAWTFLDEAEQKKWLKIN